MFPSREKENWVENIISNIKNNKTNKKIQDLFNKRNVNCFI